MSLIELGNEVEYCSLSFILEYTFRLWNVSLENPPQTVCTNLSVDVKAELRSIDRDEEDVESRGVVVELGPYSDSESE